MTELEEGGGGAASAGHGSMTSRMAVRLKSAEEGLILLFLRCDSTLHEPTIDDRVMKNTQQSAIQEGAVCHRPWPYGGKHSSLKAAIR
jgi:hypothetical protein